MKVENIQINGAKIPFIFEQNKNLPIISLKIVFTASGKIEDKKIYGLSGFCAKMLEEGTLKLGANGFAKKLEDRAIDFSVSTGIETLNFSLNSLKESFPYGVKMFAKLLENPNLTLKSLEKVKSITLGHILGKQSDFDYLASLQLLELLYPNEPLSRPALGTEKSVQDIKLEDVEKFLKTHLDLENVMVVVGGDLEKGEAIGFVKTILKGLKKGKKREISFVKTSSEKKTKVLKKPSEQAYVYFGSPFDMKMGDKEAYKSKVLAFILGASGFGSRLMEEIRVKRGLAYSAYGRINIEHSSSSFMGYLQTKNENKNEAIEVVLEVVNEFIQNGVTKEELAQAKRFLLGSEPLRNEKLNQRLGRDFIDVYSGYGLGYSVKELELIDSLKLEDLNTFISEHEEIKNLSFSIVTNEDN